MPRGAMGCLLPCCVLLLRTCLGIATRSIHVQGMDSEAWTPRHSLVQVSTSMLKGPLTSADFDVPPEASNLAAVPAEAAAATNSFGLSQRLWEGWDDAPLSALDPRATLVAEGENVSAKPSSSPVFAVAGQYDSGTNLLAALVRMNFPDARQFDQNIRRGATNVDTFFWKHKKPDTIKPSVRTSFTQQRVVALVMVRDPVSWLQSVKKAPYDLARCTNQQDWLTAPCTTPSFHDDDHGTHPPETPFHGRNIESVWNEWNRDYLHMQNFGFRDAVLVRYEDLVLDTEGELKRVGAALGLTVPDPIHQKDDPAKHHGQANGRQAAIRKLRDKTYLTQYGPGELRTACERLDAPLARQLHYYEDCP